MKNRMFILLLISLLIIFLGKSYSNNPEWIQFHPSNSGVMDDEVDGIAFDKLGNNWILNAKWVLKFNGISLVHYFEVTDEKVQFYQPTAIAVDSSNNVWIGEKSAGLLKFDGINWSLYSKKNHQIPANEISCLLYEQENNTLWMGTLWGVVKYNESGYVRYDSSNSPLKSNWINSIAIDRNGNKWFGTSDGFAKFDGINWQVFSGTINNIKLGNIYSVTTDNLGNYWFASDNGLLKYNGNDIMKFNSTNTPIHGDVVSFVNFNKNELWLSSFGSGVNCIAKFKDNQWEIFTDSSTGMPVHETHCCSIDRNNNKWFGTNDGILVYREGGVQITDVPEGSMGGPVLLTYFPNPSTNTFTINFKVQKPGIVKLEVISMDGKISRLIFDGVKNAGDYTANFNSEGLPNGVYFIRYKTADRIETGKIIINN